PRRSGWWWRSPSCCGGAGSPPSAPRRRANAAPSTRSRASSPTRRPRAACPPKTPGSPRRSLPIPRARKAGTTGRGTPSVEVVKKTADRRPGGPLVEIALGVAWLVGLSAALRVLDLALGPLPKVIVGALVVDLAAGRAGVRWSEEEQPLDAAAVSARRVA